jgi:hypothetical protein
MAIGLGKIKCFLLDYWRELNIRLTQPRPMFLSLVKLANPFNSFIDPLVRIRSEG